MFRAFISNVRATVRLVHFFRYNDATEIDRNLGSEATCAKIVARYLVFVSFRWESRSNEKSLSEKSQMGSIRNITLPRQTEKESEREEEREKETYTRKSFHHPRWQIIRMTLSRKSNLVPC